MRVSTSFIHQRGLNGILHLQNQLSDIQAKIASGKKILKPSDDPVGSAQMLRLNQAKTMLDQFERNAVLAETRLNLEEAVLASVENSLHRIRELALQANNSILSDADRQAIALEIKSRTDELISLANSRDANGEYMFGGYQVNKIPFSKLANGTIDYNGDQGQRLIQISQQNRIADGDSGFDVFMDIISGNGTFRVQDAPGNAGTGIINTGQVFDDTAYIEDTYTITFVTNSNGNLAYNVVGAASGQVIPPLPGDPVNDAPDFASSASIQFNGIETSITGTPAAGDSFSISPSPHQDIFTTVNKLATALETDTGNNADLTRVLNETTRSILDIDQAFNHISEKRAGIGARLNTIDDQLSVNQDFSIEVQSTMSGIQDLDLASAITELEQRTAALQAAQLTFVQIQSLSLFDYL